MHKRVSKLAGGVAGIGFMPPWVGEAGAGLQRNKGARSTKQRVMEFCGLPLIGQKRPMNGAQLRLLRVSEAGGRLTRSHGLITAFGVTQELTR